MDLLKRKILPQIPVETLRIHVQGIRGPNVPIQEYAVIQFIIEVWGKSRSGMEAGRYTEDTHSTHGSRRDANARSQQLQKDRHDHHNTTGSAEKAQTAGSKRKRPQQQTTQLNTPAPPGTWSMTAYLRGMLMYIIGPSDPESYHDEEHTEGLSPQAKRPKTSTEDPEHDMHLPGQKAKFVRESASGEQVELEIGETTQILKYYQDAFTSLSHQHCSLIAQAMIKRIEPGKKTKHPYNGGKLKDPEKSRPNWWPKEVPHKDPNHLLKEGETGISLVLRWC